MLALMHRHGMPITGRIGGAFIAIMFPLHHPASALKVLVKSGLDGTEQSNVWQKPPHRPHANCRNPAMLIGTLNPLEAIAFFPSDQPRNVMESGFRTLIRPERIQKSLPRIRKEWIAWDSAERSRFAPHRSQTELRKLSNNAWKEAEHLGKPAPQSVVRPIRPAEDLDNLACGDCAPFYDRNRSQLPTALPARLRNDADLNKHIATGRRLVSSQDDLLLPLLNLTP
jgi:hypothetical protein